MAKPRTLFGWSPSAIAPTFFPIIAMAMMVFFCSLFFIRAYRNPGPDDSGDETPADDTDWLRVGAFFLVLLLYALTFSRIGFLSASFLSMVAISLLAGNRNYLQIIAFSFLLPLAFYLVATRLLLVSLPEPAPVELLIARILGN